MKMKRQERESKGFTSIYLVDGDEILADRRLRNIAQVVGKDVNNAMNEFKDEERVDWEV